MFADVVEDLPEVGQPVTGYKLVYHASNGKYYKYMNMDPYELEYAISQNKDPAPNFYDDRPNDLIEKRSKGWDDDEMRKYTRALSRGLSPADAFYKVTSMPAGYYFWMSKELAYEYARNVAKEPSRNSKVVMSGISLSGIEDRNTGVFIKSSSPQYMKAFRLQYADHQRIMKEFDAANGVVTDEEGYRHPTKAQDREFEKIKQQEARYVDKTRYGFKVGRFELLRVEGNVAKKTKNALDDENEGSVMNDMMFAKEDPIATFDIQGHEIPVISFQDYVGDQPVWKPEGGIHFKKSGYGSSAFWM